MQLNQGQLVALQELKDFITSSSEKFHVLKGYAGTGKTTLLKELINFATQQNQVKSLLGVHDPIWFSFTATTNKAADVLRNTVGFPATTIHSFLNLRVKKRGKETYLVNTKKVDLCKGDVIIIDEASCIDKELMDYIEELTHDNKVILCGDPTQLKPVGSDESVAFHKGFNESVLTEIMRQSVSPLQKLCDMLRINVETGVMDDVESNDIDIVYLPRDEFEAMLVADMTRTDWKSTDSKYLGFTNAAVQNVNMGIKEAIKGMPRFYDGDLALCNKYISNSVVAISTDAVVVITRLQHDVKDLGIDGYNAEVEGYVFFTPYDYTQIKAQQDLALEEHRYDDFNYIEKNWIDLRPAYACTVHKSQGSTFTDAYVDLADINKAKFNKDLFNRLLYVAVSRASNRVIFTD